MAVIDPTRQQGGSQEPEAIDFPDAAPVTLEAALAAVASWREKPGRAPWTLHQIAIALAKAHEADTALLKGAAAEIVRLGKRIADLEADAANDASRIQSGKRAFAQLCEAVGITRGAEDWEPWIAGVRARFRVEGREKGDE